MNDILLVQESLLILKKNLEQKRDDLTDEEIHDIGMRFQLMEHESILHDFQYPMLSYLNSLRYRKRKNAWTDEEERLVLYYVSYFYDRTKISCHSFLSSLLSRSTGSVSQRYYKAKKDIQKKETYSVKQLRQDNLQLCIKNMELETIDEHRQQAFNLLLKNYESTKEQNQILQYELKKSQETTGYRQTISFDFKEKVSNTKKKVEVNRHGLVSYQ